MKSKTISIFLILLLLVISSACSNQGTNGLEFTAQKDGTYAISDYTGNDIKISIPDKKNGIPVTAIEEGAFSNAQITTVSGGKNIQTICDNAFENCYLLKSFQISGDVVKIGKNAFKNCTNLKKISLNDSLEIIDDHAFDGCEALTAIKIPNKITEISKAVFIDCTNLKKVNIPKGLKRIENYAFSGCKELSDIELPDSLEYIGHCAFLDCNSLMNITIPKSVKSVGEDVFRTYNSSITVTVEGSVIGWDGNWDNGAIVHKEDKGQSNMTIKKGTYTGSYGEIYVENNTLEILHQSGALLCGTVFTYELEENTIVCTPKKNGGIIKLQYNQQTDTISQIISNDITFTYTWSGSEKTEEHIYYG